MNKILFLFLMITLKRNITFKNIEFKENIIIQNKKKFNISFI